MKRPSSTSADPRQVEASVIGRFVARRVESVARRPRRALTVALAVALVSLALALVRIEVRTSNLDLIDADLPAVQHFLDFAADFGTPNALVLVFEGGEEQDREQAVRDLGPALRSVPGTRAVLDRLALDPADLRRHGLDEFLSSHDGAQTYVFVQPEDPRTDVRQVAPWIERLRAELAEQDLAARGVSVGFTGIPQYAIDDRDAIQADLGRLTALSLVGVVGVLVLGLGGWRWPLRFAATLCVALAWVSGFVAIWPGYVTLFSAFFASILFGLGVDFAIHAASRVAEVPGTDPVRRWSEGLGALAPALGIAGITTSCAFFALLASGFRGFEQLGWVAGAGLLICLVAVVFVLPTLGLEVSGAIERTWRTAPLVRHVMSPAGTGLAAALVALALVQPILDLPAFDGDYAALQPRDSETVRLERAMVERSDLSPQFAVFVRDSEEQALELTERLLGEESVGEVRSAADLADLESADGSPLELPDELRRSFRSEDGRYAVYAYPARDAWQVDAGGAFAERMRAIDPEVTGMPILGQVMVERTHVALVRTMWIGGGLLAVVLLAAFRRPLPALAAAVPTVLTLASLQSLMSLFGWSWNPISVMALPVVLGIAVDDGVHLVHRFLVERHVHRVLSTTGRAVVLTSATTLAAFGALTLATHRGLASFAMTLCLGVSLALLHSLLVLPRLLRRFEFAEHPDARAVGGTARRPEKTPIRALFSRRAALSSRAGLSSSPRPAQALRSERAGSGRAD